MYNVNCGALEIKKKSFCNKLYSGESDVSEVDNDDIMGNNFEGNYLH